MPSGDDLQLAGELSCENATVRCHLTVGCDIDIAGTINADNINAINVTAVNVNATNVNTTNITANMATLVNAAITNLVAQFATLVNATITNATITNATIGTLTVPLLRVGNFAMSEVNTPSINTSPQNNLVIAGLTSNMLVRFMLAGGAGNISLTGIAAPSPAIGGYSRLWVFYNRSTSTKTLTIEHQNAGSMAANRFQNHGGVARVLNPGEARAYYYDEGNSRWTEVS